MQSPFARRSNRERSLATRATLITAARRLFTERTYGDSGTPEIVAAAGLTRGALYHHFADKQALFRAVVEEEAAAVAAEIENAAPEGDSARQALIAGGVAFLTAMQRPGRTRLLLLDGPSVLGRAEMDRIDALHGTRTLRAGLAFAMRNGAIPRLPLDAVTALLSAAFDRAALAIDAGGDERDYREAIGALIDGLLKPPPGSA